MKAHPEAAVVYGDVLLIDEEGKEIGKFHSPHYDFPGVFCVEKVIAAQAAFIRRSMLEQVGLGADDSLDTCPDYEMFVRLGLKFPMLHAPGFVARYRYCRRPMDGSEPRSVERFIRAKQTVMERVFRDPASPKDILHLRRRAKARLLNPRKRIATTDSSGKSSTHRINSGCSLASSAKEADDTRGSYGFMIFVFCREFLLQ